MKIKIIAISKKNYSLLDDAIQQFVKRINHYCPCEIQVLEPRNIAATLPVEKIKTEETKLFLAQLPTSAFQLIVLDERGKSYTSPAFAALLQQKMNEGCRQIIIGIGGSYGWDLALMKSYPTLKLSDMVLPHQLVRLVLVEQLYRAFTIIKNENYHH